MKQKRILGNILKGYEFFNKAEYVVASVLFLLIVALCFLSAISRKLGAPIQWAMDVTQLSFAWLAFLSGDIALRAGALPGLDMLYNKLGPKMKTVANIISKLLMLALLLFFIYFGFRLAFSNKNRTFQTLPIKYMWVSISLPVCSIFMVVSIFINMIKKAVEKN